MNWTTIPTRVVPAPGGGTLVLAKLTLDLTADGLQFAESQEPFFEIPVVEPGGRRVIRPADLVLLHSPCTVFLVSPATPGAQIDVSVGAASESVQIPAFDSFARVRFQLPDLKFGSAVSFSGLPAPLEAWQGELPTLYPLVRREDGSTNPLEIKLCYIDVVKRSVTLTLCGSLSRRSAHVPSFVVENGTGNESSEEEWQPPQTTEDSRTVTASVPNAARDLALALRKLPKSPAAPAATPPAPPSSEFSSIPIRRLRGAMKRAINGQVILDGEAIESSFGSQGIAPSEIPTVVAQLFEGQPRFLSMAEPGFQLAFGTLTLMEGPSGHFSIGGKSQRGAQLLTDEAQQVLVFLADSLLERIPVLEGALRAGVLCAPAPDLAAECYRICALKLASPA